VSSWNDCIIPIEVKTPKNENTNAGKHQAHEYLAAAYRALGRVDEPSPLGNTPRISVFTDMAHVVVYHWVGGDILKAIRSGVLDLFPTGWKQQDSPTLGFQWLCHALTVPMPKVANVRIGEQSVPVVSELYRTHSITVNRLRWNGEDCVVKIANERTGYAVAVLRKEMALVRTLMELKGFGEGLAELYVSDVYVRTGIMMKFATPIEIFVTDLASGGSLGYADAEQVVGMLRNLFRSLLILHREHGVGRLSATQNLIIFTA
jgi:hypothetical protein